MVKLYIGPLWRQELRKLQDQGSSVIYLDDEGWESRIEDIEMCSSVSLVGIGDISTKRNAISKLLKFTEEARFDIVLAASRDVFDPVILSRMDQAEKHPDVVKNDGDSLQYFRDAVKEADEDEAPITDADIVSSFPSVLPVVLNLRKSQLPAKERLVRLI